MDYLFYYLLIGLLLTILGKLFHEDPIDSALAVIILMMVAWPILMFLATKKAIKGKKKS
jgi:hypothetical protein